MVKSMMTKMLRMSLFYGILFLPTFVHNLDAITKGSDFSISSQPYFVFPAADSNSPTVPNRILLFGSWRAGFGLQDSTTSCTYKTLYPFSGPLNLHGGRLFLETDMICNNVASIDTSGSFVSAVSTTLPEVPGLPETATRYNPKIDFSSTVTGIPATFNTIFDRVNVFLNGDFTISGTVRIKGKCVLDGRDSRVILDPNANIIVDHASSLILKNLELDNVSGYKLRCVNNSARVIFDNVQMMLSGNYTFSTGSMEILQSVDVSGPYTFNYTTDLTSTIDTASFLHLNEGVIMNIGRKKGVSSREPLNFTDNSSMLWLANCTLNVTSSGMRLTKGTILNDGEVHYQVNGTTASTGLIIGAGDAAQDCIFEIAPDAVVNLVKGAAILNVVNNNIFLSDNTAKKFVSGQNYASTLFMQQNLNMRNIGVTLGQGFASSVSTGKKLTFNNCFLSNPVSDFMLSGTSIGQTTYLLDRGGSVRLQNGTFPFALQVVRDASLSGVGDFANTITLNGGSSALTLNLDGDILNNIAMNGGSVTLARDARFGLDDNLTGSGTVNLSSKNLTLRVQDLVCTSSIVWNGSQGSLTLDSDMSLVSQMTFSGNCTLNGNGNVLTLAGPGKIVVERGSSLTISNAIIENIHGQNIACNDNFGTILFDDSSLFLNDDYTLTKGALKFKNQVSLYGINHVFALQTRMTSTVERNSMLNLSRNLTLSCDSLLGRNDQLAFVDASSLLNMDNSILYATAGGLQLSKGTMNIVGSVIFFAQGSEIFLGNNLDSEHDMNTRVASGATLILDEGYLTYQNIGEDAWEMTSNISVLKLNDHATLTLNQDLNIVPGTLLRCPGSDYIENDGAHLTGDTSFAC